MFGFFVAILLLYYFLKWWFDVLNHKMKYRDDDEGTYYDGHGNYRMLNNSEIAGHRWDEETKDLWLTDMIGNKIKNISEIRRERAYERAKINGYPSAILWTNLPANASLPGEGNTLNKETFEWEPKTEMYATGRKFKDVETGRWVVLRELKVGDEFIHFFMDYLTGKLLRPSDGQLAYDEKHGIIRDYQSIIDKLHSEPHDQFFVVNNKRYYYDFSNRKWDKYYKDEYYKGDWK